MKRYLSLALLASSVLGAGCCCPGKCSLKGFPKCCSGKKCCSAHTSAKPIDAAALSQTSVPARMKGAESTHSNRPEDIAEQIARQTEDETTSPDPDTSSVTELSPPAAPIVPASHQEDGMSEDEAKVIATEHVVSGDDHLSSYIPPPPPIKMTLSGVGSDKDGLNEDLVNSARNDAKATNQQGMVNLAKSESERSDVSAVDPLPPPATEESAPEMASTVESSSTGNEVAADRVEFAHQKDYMWVQGKLIRIYSRGGYWQIRYASYDENDAYGGKFVIVGSVGDDLREGDVVRIRGKVLGENRWLNGTEYRADSMQLVQRGTAPFAN